MDLKQFAIILVMSLLTPLCFAGKSTAQKSFSQQYIEGMIKGRPELFNKVFAANIKILPEYDKAFLGQDSVASYYAAIFKQYDIRELSRSTLEVIDIGERSVEIGTFKLSYTDKGANQTFTVPGTYLEIWDVSQPQSKLLTMAWNYDEHFEGVENSFRAQSTAGVHYAFQPVAPIDSPINFEVAATHNLVTTLMLRKQPETLAIRFADDGWFAAHGMPIQKGKQAMTAHLIEYAKNWPAFDYIDVNAHEIYAHGEYTIEHFSYNLRWRTVEYSGIAIGKGIRIAKRNAQGVLQMYRSIPMHD